MKKILLALLLLVMSASLAKAQDLQVGVAGGQVFNNAYIGTVIKLEVPIGKRFELDPSFEIYPEIKPGYGVGYGGSENAEGIVWIKPTLGLDFSLKSSSYSVTTVSKTEQFLSPSLILRMKPFNTPSRFTVGPLWEINNRIFNGVETNHILGGHFKMDFQMYQKGNLALRVSSDTVVGRVLNQGNPVCDGTYGNGSQAGLSPCPRSGAVSGGVELQVSLEWGKYI